MKRIICRKIKKYFFFLLLFIGKIASITVSGDLLSSQTPERLYSLIKNVEHHADKGCQSSQACMLLFLAADIKRDFSEHIKENFGEKIDFLWCEKKFFEKIYVFNKNWLLKDAMTKILETSIENERYGEIPSKIHGCVFDKTDQPAFFLTITDSFAQTPDRVYSLLSYIEKRGHEGCRAAQIFILLLLAHQTRSDFFVYNVWSKAEEKTDPLWGEKTFLTRISSYINAGWVKAFDIQNQITKLIHDKKEGFLMQIIHENGMYYA